MPILVIGIGNALRGDDAAGLLTVRRLQIAAESVQVIEHSGEGADLMTLWEDRHADLVICVDAVTSGESPGTIYRLNPRLEPIPAAFFSYSTHAFGLAEALELARILDRLPPQIIIYGIEGACFCPGASLSDPVRVAIDAVLERVTHEIALYLAHIQPN